MGQLTERSKPTRRLGGARFFRCRLEAVRPRENGWHEPYELRGLRTVFGEAGGEIPPVYSAQRNGLEKKNDFEVTYCLTWTAIRSPKRSTNSSSFDKKTRPPLAHQECFLDVIINGRRFVISRNEQIAKQTKKSRKSLLNQATLYIKWRVAEFS